MLKAAANVVLRNGGERLVLTCGADQEAMRVELGKRPEPTVSRESDRYTLELIVPAIDGMVHNDGFRTPIFRITCPTCVEQIAKSRTRRRLQKKRGATGNSRAQPADLRGLHPDGGNRGINGRPTKFRNSPEMTFTRFKCAEVTELDPLGESADAPPTKHRNRVSCRNWQ